MSDSATQVIARLDQKLQSVPGIKLYMQPAQDVSVGARLGRTLYQYTLQDPNSDELNQWAPKILTKMQQIPLLADVTSDQENSGTTETLTYDRDQAARFGIQPAAIDNILYDAFGQREVAQYFTGNKAYYVILEALAERVRQRLDAGQTVRRFIERDAGAALDARAPDDRAGAAAGDQPSEPVSVGDDLVQPEGQCLARRRGEPGAACGGIDGRAAHRAGQLPGHRAGVPGVPEYGAVSGRGGAGRGATSSWACCTKATCCR